MKARVVGVMRGRQRRSRKGKGVEGLSRDMKGGEGPTSPINSGLGLSRWMNSLYVGREGAKGDRDQCGG